MSRAEANKEYSTFIAGIQTEASPLTYPENASIDEENFVLDRNGSRRRRLGIDYETDYLITDIGDSEAAFESKALTSFEWHGANDDANVGILVVQVGSELYFYDLYADAVMATALNGGSTVTIDNDPTLRVQFAPIAGRLVIATGTAQVTVIEYNPIDDEMVKTRRKLYVRDFFGVDDKIGITTRPATLTNTHNYNLLNQGWSSTNIAAFNTEIGTYPSNADIMQLGKDADENFDATLITKQNVGSTPAPKGRNIIEVFNRGTTRNIGGLTPASPPPLQRDEYFGDAGDWDYEQGEYTISEAFLGSSGSTAALNEDYTLGGCTTVAQYAGRIFYSGAKSDIVDGDSKSPSLGSYVFFSQIVDTQDKINLCYQEADPTSENISDLIDSDGGHIKITEASNIIRLMAVSNGLVIFAQNGIWQIIGTDVGFSAAEYEVIKISEVGVTAPQSIVVVDSAVLYWGNAGIFILQPDQVSGRLAATSLSLTTVQTLYEGIGGIVKKNVVGTFDEASNQVRWMYTTSSNYDGTSQRYKFDRELVFDIALQAFYKTSITSLESNSPYIAAYIRTEDFTAADNSVKVVDESDAEVVDESLNLVVASVSQFSRSPRSVKYLTIVPGTTYGMTTSEYSNSSYLDWFTKDGVGLDAPAYLLTGYDTFQDTQRLKKATFITTHMGFTETVIDENLEAIGASSCLLQAQWDWTNDVAAGRWSAEQQIYRLRKPYVISGVGDDLLYGQKVVTARSKLRGKGRALSLLFNTEAGKDCLLFGWGLNATGETKV